MKAKSVICRSLVAFIVVTIAVLCTATTTAAGNADPALRPVDPLRLIEHDFRQGNIDLDQKVRLQIQALTGTAKLPAKYLSTGDTPVRILSRYPTIVLRDIWLHYDQLSPSTQAAFRSAFARPATEFTYVSPGGNFLLHYDTTGADSVPSADLDVNGIPDYVEHIAGYCDSTWDKHAELGYLAPPADAGLGGDDRTDIYFKASIYYGFTIIEGSGSYPWGDGYGYVTVHSHFEGFPPNDDPEGDALGAAKATVAHEFHHLIQFAYDLDEDEWFIEMDATHFEDLVFDQSNDNYNFIDTFFVNPQTSLMENTLHAYASFVYPLFLSQFFDTSLMTAAWEGARYANIFNTLRDTMAARYGWTQDSAFAEFAAWNYITSVRDDGFHHEEASAYPGIRIGRTHSTYPVVTTNVPEAPEGYAAGYIQFYPPATPKNVTLTFNGVNSHEWAAFLIKSASENDHEIIRIPLDQQSYYGEVTIDSAYNYYQFALVGVNLSEFDSAPASFGYSAESYIPRAVIGSIDTPYSQVYSGATRSYAYGIQNPGPADDIYDVSVWDTAGWMVPDTTRISISPGSTKTFVQDFGPPQYTPIGSTSELHFSVRSVNDPSVADSQSIAVSAAMQRGDIDFSGRIDISDLTYLVGFMFSEGPEPLPVLNSADISCDDSVDIQDLTSLVQFQFQQGPPAACNPY